MDKQAVLQRQRAVRKGMKSAGVDCLLVTINENITYLSGFTGHDSWLLVTGRGATLVTDSRYAEQAEAECAGCKIVQRSGSIIKAAAKIIDKSKAIKVIGVEDSMSVALLKSVKKGFAAKIKPVRNVVELPRRTKIADEIKGIKKAAKISYECLFEALDQLRAGMTESELTGMIEFEMRKRQATPFFDTIVCFGSNGSRNHHQPGGKKLKKNDSILIDFGAKFNSYGCDITRSFAVGKPTPMYEKAWFTVKAAQAVAIEAIKEGVKLSEIDSICREAIRKTSFPVYGHGTGHGLGLVVHEEPCVAGVSKDIAQAGDVVTIEPGIYLPGKFGIRIEDDILITKTGYKILSKDTKFGFSEPDMPVLKC